MKAMETLGWSLHGGHGVLCAVGYVRPAASDLQRGA